MEEKTCSENTTGQKNLWSVLKKQVDVERFDHEKEEKKPVMSTHNGRETKNLWSRHC